jgi:hypothetical protein
MSRAVESRPILHLLRFLFRDTAPQFYLVADATGADVAAIWSKLSARQAGPPVGVAISLAPPQAMREAVRELA